jgi:hypothetical protein
MTTPNTNPAPNTSPMTTVAQPTNGATTEVPAKSKAKPRAVPLIGCNANKAEYDEIKGSLDKLLPPALRALNIEVSLGAYVLQHALRSIRNPALDNKTQEAPAKAK